MLDELAKYVWGIADGKGFGTYVDEAAISPALTLETLNEAYRSLMAQQQMPDSSYAMRYGMMSRQEAMDREQYEREREMRRRQSMYEVRSMQYRPYDDGSDFSDSRLARENDKLKAELHATKQAAEAKKAERIKSRENLIAHYYSMRPARANA